jgi:N-acetylglutamate synthase-like GNAT family acetyltransferase
MAKTVVRSVAGEFAILDEKNLLISCVAMYYFDMEMATLVAFI